MYTWLSTGVVMLAKMGGQVMVAQSIGQRKKERAIAFGRGAMQMTLILSILYGLVTVTFAAPLIGFFHLNSAEIANISEDCLRFDYFPLLRSDHYRIVHSGRKQPYAFHC